MGGGAKSTSNLSWAGLLQSGHPSFGHPSVARSKCNSKAGQALQMHQPASVISSVAEVERRELIRPFEVHQPGVADLIVRG